MRTAPRMFLLPALVIVLGCALLATVPRADDSQGAPEEPGTPETSSGGETAATPARQPGTLLPGSTRPPQPLKKVGDHWTPYDPPDPESFPKDATLHIIVPGDTLWDLADLAFGNPYLWPQIWNENRYILDSHWIYPGDPLLLPARPTVITEVVPQGQAGAPPAASPADAEDTIPEVPVAEQPEEAEPELIAEQPMMEEGPSRPRRDPGENWAHADDGDIRCGGYVAPKDSRMEYFIANQDEENKVSLTEGDIVYVGRNKRGDLPSPGSEFSIVLREAEVRHPVSNRLLGHYYKRAGTLRILASQEETALAKIVMACDQIRTGYELTPLIVGPPPDAPAPAFDRHQALDPSKPSGYVVHTGDNMERVGTGYLVDINLGYEDGLKPGDFLKIYIPTQPFDKYPALKYDYQWENRRFQSVELRKDNRNVPPPRLIGQIVVLTTEKRTATAKIVYAVGEVEVGHQVELY